MKIKLIKICIVVVLMIMVLLFGWMCLSVKDKKIEGGFSNMKVDYMNEYFRNFDNGVKFKNSFNAFNDDDTYDTFNSLKTFNVLDTYDSHDLKFSPKIDIHDSHDSRINIFDDGTYDSNDTYDSTTSNIKTFNIDALNSTDKSSPIVSSSFETVQYDI